ncbi:ABC transporter permease [Niallia sp. Krafla_26]|uniref:ABC transporter permease n=1 Tax=Niallia sp. Krafla_26 TaxID=3064703 RepID=UPI003D180057
MKLVTSFQLACLGLWANKFRVLLSMLGIIIGVFAVIVLSSIALGVKDTIMKQLGGLGAEQMMVVPGRVLGDETGNFNFMSGMSGAPSTLTYNDVKEIEKVDSVESVTPILETVGRIDYKKSEQKNAVAVEGLIIGTSVTYPDVMHTGLAEGRFFSKEEAEGMERVVVLGSRIHSALLEEQMQEPVMEEGGNDGQNQKWWQRMFDWLIGTSVRAEEVKPTLVGKEVLIHGVPFKVVGVLEPQATLGMTTDNSIVIPIEMVLEVTSVKNLTSIYVQPNGVDELEQVEKDVYSAVRVHHSEADFSIVKQTEMLEAINKVTQILQVMLTGITAIALLISGVGIMNVMVMSVRERTREIGIRKALGASTIEILYQFFFETLLLCTLGGAIGLALGFGFVEWWNGSISIFSLSMPIWLVKLALFSSIGIGCICGIYPAIKAARLQPNKALRFE